MLEKADEHFSKFHFFSENIGYCDPDWLNGPPQNSNPKSLENDDKLEIETHSLQSLKRSI